MRAASCARERLAAGALCPHAPSRLCRGDRRSCTDVCGGQTAPAPSTTTTAQHGAERDTGTTPGPQTPHTLAAPGGGAAQWHRRRRRQMRQIKGSGAGSRGRRRGGATQAPTTTRGCKGRAGCRRRGLTPTASRRCRAAGRHCRADAVTLAWPRAAHVGTRRGLRLPSGLPAARPQPSATGHSTWRGRRCVESSTGRVGKAHGEPARELAVRQEGGT